MEQPDIAARLKAARERQVISQEELGRQSGVSETTINRIEGRHNTRPRYVTIRRLAEALNVDARWLMAGGPPPQARDPAET